MERKSKGKGFKLESPLRFIGTKDKEKTKITGDKTFQKEKHKTKISGDRSFSLINFGGK